MPGSPPLRVGFVNENTLGHRSYLPRFVEELNRRPELGILPLPIDVTPLPPALERKAHASIRGLRRFGLDFHIARWRRVVSARAREQVLQLRRDHALDALVINTQSVGLALQDIAREIPTWVCLDATFEQLRHSAWFSMNRVAGWLTPLTLAPIRKPERDLFDAATGLLAWSGPVRDSLLADYGIAPGRIRILPPSLDLQRLRRPTGAARPGRPQILFVGGDFRRKGGPLLVEAFEAGLRDLADLHIVTQSEVPARQGLFVHHDVAVGSPRWWERWTQASVFVFPSRLETFGIVLLEALAFEVPVVASDVGAARDVLESGPDGGLLTAPTARSVRDAVRKILLDPAASASRTAAGRRRVESEFDLATNTTRLAGWLQAASPGTIRGRASRAS